MPDPADLAVLGGTIVTMDAQRRIIDRGAIVVRRDRVVWVGPREDAVVRYLPERTLPVDDGIVLPGFINAHAHATHILLRGGLSQDRDLYDWLANVLHPAQAAYRPEDASIGASLFALEAIRGGTTTVVDNESLGRVDDIAEATIKAFRRFGLRLIYARMFSDGSGTEAVTRYEDVKRRSPNVRHAPWRAERARDAMAHIESLMDRFAGEEGGLIRVWPAPSAPGLTSPEGLLLADELARRRGCMTTIHLAEAPIDATIDGRSATTYLESIGYLSPRVLAAHCVQCGDGDLHILARHGTSVAHSPVSNLYLASGVAPVRRMVEAGVTVALGTDDGNCNDSVNMFQTMKFAALLQKGITRDPGALRAERVLEMATIEGARAIGLEGELGSLEPGKKADLIVLGRREAQLWPAHHLPGSIVYQAYGSEVDTVVINGRPVMVGRTLTALDAADENQLLLEAQKASAAIASRARLEGLARRWVH